MFRKKASSRRPIRSTATPRVQIIKQATEQANSLDTKKVAAVMHSGKPFKTVLGDITFDSKGDLASDYVFAGKKQHPLRPLRLEEGPGRQDHLLRGMSANPG